MLSQTHSERPLVSVVVEGYNEAHHLGTAEDTIRALCGQDFPLGRVSVTLVGSSAQAAAWRARFTDPAPFLSVEAVTADEASYYQLKNIGGARVRGEVIAFTDSDATPERGWLAAIVEGIEEGADVVVGPSLFSSERRGPESALMQAAASIAWGFVVKVRDERASGGFLSHNVAVRADSFRRHPYPQELGRTCGSPLLYRALAGARQKFALKPGQRVAHAFTWGWWLGTFHFRAGYEVYWIRRLDPAYPNHWIARTWLLEPPLTTLWHMLLDVPQWFRFAKLLRLGRARRLALLPLVVLLSAAARGSEMAGMYCTIFANERMKRWAEAS
jgi:glycosyltransferase involved in cell wall biosynthesis